MAGVLQRATSVPYGYTADPGWELALGTEIEKEGKTACPERFLLDLDNNPQRGFGPRDLTGWLSQVANFYFNLAKDPANSENLGIQTAYVTALIIQLFSLTWNALNESRTVERQVFEQLTASKQCREIIGEPRNDTICWLCGYALADYPFINTKNIEWDETNKAQGSNAPQCEHVLPLSAGLLFYGVPTVIDEARDIERYKHNYGWAHALCNVKKDRCLFVNIFEADGKLKTVPEINESNIGMYLTDLYIKIFECGGLKAGIPKPERSAWIQSRGRFIIQKITPLLEAIRVERAKDAPMFIHVNFTLNQFKRCIYGIIKRYMTTATRLPEFPEFEKLVTAQKKLIFKQPPYPICSLNTRPSLRGSGNSFLQDILTDLVNQQIVPPEIAQDTMTICLSEGGKRRKTRKFNKKRKMHRKTYKK